ncbi:MAG: sigma-70 family RNA polymerase sigma factor [Candidatus Kerfeldbacteria bacterium]|nr:sigma-70 family RNA polymerase sigma factor [Candidatus Kerfeldbacteria bacterium]
MTPEQEQECIRAVANNPEAFAKLYDDTYDRVFVYILKRCGDYHLAQDIVAETYLKAIKHIGKFRYTGKPFIAWLYRIACNELNMYFRKSLKYTCEELELHHELIDYRSDVVAEYEAIEKGAEYAAMRSALARLSGIDQHIITLKFFEEKTIPEISDILDLKEGTVKSRLSRALRKIEKQLQRSPQFAIR